MAEPTSEDPNSQSRSSPSIPLKTKLLLSVSSLLFNAPRRSNGTVNRWLLSFIDLKLPANPTPSRGVSTCDLMIDATRDLWFRLFLPSSTTSTAVQLPVIVFFHGGGFFFNSPATSTYDKTCRRIAHEVPAIIASVNYRLAPEHRCPAQYEDCLDALNFLDSSDDPALDNWDLSRCFVVGDSAGGNIAHHVTLRWCDQVRNRPANRVGIAGMVAVQPFFGGVERVPSETRKMWDPLLSVEFTDWAWRAFLPEGEGRDHWAVNVFGPRDMRELPEGFPPVMVVIGGFDRLQDWQRRYVVGLRKRGKEVVVKEYRNAFHAFYVFPELRESRLFIEDLRGFLNKCCSSFS